jgi:hypothetical protein
MPSKYRGWVYQSKWMWRLHIPPVPLWTIGWLVELIDLLKGRKGGGGGDEPRTPF